MVRSLNHRHRKNKIPCLSLWIPEMSFVSLYHIYTVVFIYCCRQISLKYPTASYNPHFHPEKHSRFCGKNKKCSTKAQPLGSPPLNCTKYLFHVLASMLLRTIASTLQKPLTWDSHVFSENQMVREPFQVNSGRKNSHSFILDWKTSLNFGGGGTQFWKSQFFCPPIPVWCFLTKKMSQDSI